ncbi:MAG: sugar ABC transporter permease [Clostridia bacterium]|nr:sugar ABC transporter permease [Clostridia bacterium]
MKIIKNKISLGIRNEITHFKKNWQLTAIAIPAIIMIFIFNYLPLYGLIIPFKNYIPRLGIAGSEWVGLQNFEFLIKTGTIWDAVFNTLAYNLVFLFVGVMIEVCVALMLYELSKKAVKVYQTAMLVPYFLSWVVVAYVLNTLLDKQHGILNNIITFFGGSEIMWYNEPKYWPVIIILSYLWKQVGYGAIVYLASLSGLDSAYFEAAKIYGATKLQQIRYISLPLIRPVITIMLILGIGKIMKGDFGLFYNVTMDSPLLYPTTDVIDTYVYRSLMNVSDLGMSSTTGFVQSVVGFILVITTNHIVNKIDPSNALF